MAKLIANLYISLANGRLLDEPPPRSETGTYFFKDTCYTNPTVYCEDLIAGHRKMVASWYLPVERLAAETLWVGLGAIIVLTAICPFLLCPSDIKRGEHMIKSPLWMTIMSIICLVIQTYYKIMPGAYTNKIYFMIMPCNITWAIHSLMALFTLTGPIKHAIIQFLFCFQVLVWVVFSEADTEDLNGPFEVEFFWINHMLLLFPPLYYALGGEVKLLTGHGFISELWNFTSWILFSSAVMSIIYFVIATPLSFVSLLNLNYMLSPPLGFESFGENYRLYSQALIACGFVLARLVTVIVASVGSKKKKPSEKAE